MRILYIANVRMPTEKAHGFAIYNMCIALQRAGHTISLLVPKRVSRVPDSVRAWYAVRDVIPVRRLPTIDVLSVRLFPKHLAFAIQAGSFYVAAFAVLLFRRRLPIYTRDIALVALRLLGYPVFLEIHAVPRHSIGKFLVRRATSVVTIAAAARDVLARSGVLTDRMLVAPSGVDLSVFDLNISKGEARRELRLGHEAFFAVYTGSFTTMGEEKGLAECIDAVVETGKCTLIAVGGSEEDIERYRAYAASRGVADRTMFIGRSDQLVLAMYQKAADVLLAPFPDTPHYRTNMSPMKLFEYAASQVPVIASDLATIRSVFSDKEVRFVAPGDSSALARAIMTMRAEPRQGEALAAAAYERVSREYTWAKRAAVVASFIARRLDRE